MTVSSATNGIQSDATNTQNTSSVTQAIGQTQDQFLKLLMTQMQNQDPMNPLDNAQVTSQIAQISTVTGIQQLNDTVKALTSAMSSMQTMQTASLIGKNVLAEGNYLQLASGAGVAGYNLGADADAVTVSVYDSSGSLVYTAPQGGHSAGSYAFQWDGKTNAGGTAPDGNYSIAVSATQGGNKVDATALAVGQVNSVTLTSTGAQLNVNGLGALDMSKVKQIL